MARRSLGQRAGAKTVVTAGGLASVGLHLSTIGAPETGWLWIAKITSAIIITAVLHALFGLHNGRALISLLIVGLTIWATGNFGRNYLWIMVGVLVVYTLIILIAKSMRDRRRQLKITRRK